MSTATLHNEKMKTLVPQLRFQEFDGEWKNEPIGKYIDLISGIAFKGEDISEDSTGVPILRGINITEGYIRHNENIDRYYLGNTDKLDKIRLKEGDLVLGMDGSKVGKNSALITKKDVDSLLIQRVARIRAKKNTSLEFIYLHINSIIFHKYVDVVNTSSGIPHISSKQINDFKIYFPEYNEQQKIASFLSALDEKIKQLTRKVTLLEHYKKGVMQQLFSGKLRFKDENGKDYPDWEEKKLGDVAEKRIIKNKDNKINLVFTNSAVQGIVNQRDFFDKDIANQNNLLGYYIVEKNDFVYNPRISTYAPVGPISRNYLNTGIMSPLYSVFRFKEGNLDFIECFFNSSIWHIHMKNISNYGARDDRMSFSTGDFYKMPIPFPCIEEQKKIANFLSGIDSKIEKVNQQLAQTQTFKKGLLQQLFV